MHLHALGEKKITIYLNCKSNAQHIERLWGQSIIRTHLETRAAQFWIIRDHNSHMILNRQNNVIY